MGIQGFFNYLNKKTTSRTPPNERINGIIEVIPEQPQKLKSPSRKNLPNKSKILEKIPTFDIVLFDFQSLIYAVAGTYEEIDKLIILLYTLLNDVDSYNKYNVYYSQQICNIIHNHEIFFTRLLQAPHNIQSFNGATIPNDTLKILYDKLTLITNEEVEAILIEEIEDYVNQYVFDYKNIPKIEKDFVKDVYIYFDGVPSLSKIKEQLHRRVNRTIESYIHNNIKNMIFGGDNILNHLITSKLPVIGHDTQIVNKLRDKFQAQGFTCNSIKNILGEAEHQMMIDISKNKDRWNGKNIIIVSPDADLILLGIIQKTLYNLNIYIHKLETVIFDKLGFDVSEKYPGGFLYTDLAYIKEYYININALSESPFFNINNTIIKDQQLLDLCFVLLLIGDDFIPSIVSLNVNSISDIIQTLEILLKKNPEFKIVERDELYYKINYINFIEYIMELQGHEKDFFYKISIEGHNPDFIGIGRDKSDFEKYNYYYNIFNNVNLQKYFYYKKSLSNNIFLSKKVGRYHKYLLTNATEFKLGRGKSEFHNNILKTKYEFGMLQDKIFPHDEDIIKNYLEGCQFIFDLYFNNTINNYRWYYRYEEAPTLTNLALFLNSKDISEIIPLFNIPSESPSLYMTSEQYQKYSNYNKNEILKQIINNIIAISTKPLINNLDDINIRDIHNINLELYNTSISSHDEVGEKTYAADSPIDKFTEEAARKYFVYSNLPIIYHCYTQKYLNKCLSYNPILSDSSIAVVDSLAGGYKQKYLKYKQKYLELKKILN